MFLIPTYQSPVNFYLNKIEMSKIQKVMKNLFKPLSDLNDLLMLLAHR